MATKGGQLDNQNARTGRVWREALHKATVQFECSERGVKQGKALHRIATNVVRAAVDGEEWAITEIGNRYDGKAAQALQLSSDDDKPLFQAIKMVIVANNPNQINGLANDPTTIDGELVQEKITVGDNREGQGTGVGGPIDETPSPHLRVPHPNDAEVNLEPSANE